MRRSSPDSTSGRSPDSPNREVHLTPRTGSRDPRRHRFDAVVAAFVAACRAEVLSERTIEFYLEGLNSYRAFSGADERDLTLADVDVDTGLGRDPGAVNSRDRLNLATLRLGRGLLRPAAKFGPRATRHESALRPVPLPWRFHAVRDLGRDVRPRVVAHRWNHLPSKYLELGERLGHRPQDERVEAQVDRPLHQRCHPGLDVPRPAPGRRHSRRDRADHVVNPAHVRRVAPGRSRGIVNQLLHGTEPPSVRRNVLSGDTRRRWERPVTARCAAHYCPATEGTGDAGSGPAS